MTDTQALIEELTTLGNTHFEEGNGVHETVWKAAEKLAEQASEIKNVLDREAATTRQYAWWLDEADAKLAKAGEGFIAIRDAYLDDAADRAMMKIAVNALAELGEE